MKHAVSVLTNRAASQAINTWRNFADQALFELKVLRQFAADLNDGSLRRAMNSWRELAGERQALQLFMADLSDSTLRRAMNSWCEMADERSQHQEMLRKSAVALVSTATRQAMNS
eukprot:1592424-Prymnesium_polylepis.1